MVFENQRAKRTHSDMNSEFMSGERKDMGKKASLDGMDTDQVQGEENKMGVMEDANVVELPEGVEAENIEEENEDEEDEEDEEEEEEEDVVVVDNAAGIPKQEPSVMPPANRFPEMASRLMRPVPDYPIKEETYNVWEIKDWNGLKEDKVRGPRFRCGGFDWNILLFPRGNNNYQMSIYIEPHPIPDAKGVVDDEWYVCAKFGLNLWNPRDPTVNYGSGSFHRFSKNETDWGFASFIDLRTLTSVTRGHSRPLMENNQLNITAFVRVIDDSSTGVLWHPLVSYDSKASTGYVGLNNQGATCYLNSLLQSYFTTKNFRKLVYQIPYDSSSNVPTVSKSLQKIFYLLLTLNEPVGTLDITKSFGWNSSDAFTQHDVQELNRILMDKLEYAMKNTAIEGALNGIFVGKMKSYIKCVDVPYESSRVEDFWDIQLNVKGFRNLKQAFDNYVEIEMLEGDNKYQAGDDYGYQNAKKGVVFRSFPPVLHLQLKRFEFDFMVEDLVKIDDFYEFPDSIDLTPYLDPDLPEEVKKENWTYKLHGVLVHQGSISNGHYYTMIKPNAYDNTWLRFDDDKVWKVTPYQVFHENFGADELSPAEFSRLPRIDQNENLIRRATSAYMLVYYRESELPNILPEDDNAVNKYIPPEILDQLSEEVEEMERIEKAKQEVLFYINVKFVTIKCLNNHDGFDLYPDSTNKKFYSEDLLKPEQIPVVFKVKKDASFEYLHRLIGSHLGYLPNDVKDESHGNLNISSLPFRLLLVNHRNNHTNRADIPVPEELREANISTIYRDCFNKKYDEMVFFVEELNNELHNLTQNCPYDAGVPESFKFENVIRKVEDNKSTQTYSRFRDASDDSSYITIFLKYFDPLSGQYRALTHVTVLKSDRIDSLSDHLYKLLGFSTDRELIYFEELSPIKIDRIDPGMTFDKQELNNGDIICIQTALDANVLLSCEFKDVREYAKFILTRIHILVKPADVTGDEVDETEEGGKVELGKCFDTWVSSQYSYNELVKKIAQNLGDNVDPDYLRLFIVNYQGVRYPMKHTHDLFHFFPRLVPVSQITTFEYETLKMTLKEFESMKSMNVYWIETIVNYSHHEILLPNESTVADLIYKLSEKVNIPEKKFAGLLVWAGIDHKYVELIRFDRIVETINENYDIYVGYFPVEVDIFSSHDMIKPFEGREISLSEIDDQYVREELQTSRYFAKHLNVIPAFQFHKTSTFHHGVPFILPVYPNESLSEVKRRIQRRLGLNDQAFEKVRLALADSNDRGRYLDQNDDTVLYNEIVKFENSVSLALDHPDRSPRRASQFDKGISIK